MSGINTGVPRAAAGLGTLVNFVDPATGRIKLVRNRGHESDFKLPTEATDQDATAQQQVEYDAKTGTVKVTITYSYKTYDRPAEHAQMTAEQMRAEARTERVRTETKHVKVDDARNGQRVVHETDSTRIENITPLHGDGPLGAIALGPVAADSINDCRVAHESEPAPVARTAIVTSLTPKLVAAINVDSRITDRRAVEDQLGSADFSDKSEAWHRDRIMDLLFERYDANSAEAVHRSLMEQLFPRPVFAA